MTHSAQLLESFFKSVVPVWAMLCSGTASFAFYKLVQTFKYFPCPNTPNHSQVLREVEGILNRLPVDKGDFEKWTRKGPLLF